MVPCQLLPAEVPIPGSCSAPGRSSLQSPEGNILVQCCQPH